MSEPLEPYEGLVKSSSGHKLWIRGWTSLPFRLGTVEVSLSVLVADQPHVDTILGVDALGTFGAVIDVPESTMTLKSSGDVFPLGFTVIVGSYATAMTSSVRLPPHGQEELVMVVVVGDVSSRTTVLVEGSIGLPPALCVALSLCTSAFVSVAAQNPVPVDVRRAELELVASTVEELSEAFEEKVKASKPDVPADKGMGMKADFSESKLSVEQKGLFQAELDNFSNLFVESSKKQGLMERLFCIDYRKLNAVTVKDCYPMPLMDAILDVLGGSQLFSTMDTASGYWNVPMHPDSVFKTEITCKMYIPRYALISAPLERLKMKDAPFVWAEDCESAFRQLRRALMKPSILVYPDGQKRFKLYLFTGSQKNWISKQDGISEIECWGVVWASRKFQRYLDKRGSDLYTDHQALTWVFDPGNRTINAKLARWARELSRLQFKVHHKPGTAMDHMDGLSRLPTDTVATITMRDLLNPEGTADDVLPSSVGEPPAVNEDGELVDGHVDDVEPELRNEEDDVDHSRYVPVSPVDRFSPDREQFVREQQEIPWVRALVAFLVDGALPMDPHLRSTIVKIRSRYVVEDGLLMRRVNLPARVGPARSLTVPVVPLRILRLSYTTVTRTWKGSRPWRAALMQCMPVFELTGQFSLLVLDAVGPLPETDRRNKYIVVFVGYFTWWAKAFAVGRLDAVTFVEVMMDGVVSRHGVPSRLLSDNGRNFTSEIARSFYQTLGIKKLFGSAHHPQTQDLVEREVTINVNRLKKYRGRWTRPFMDEVPGGVVNDGETMEDGPLEEADLPNSSFAERLSVGRGDSTLIEVDAPLLEVVVKRVANGCIE
ncbi:unnamed protein product [Phytophthora fragariaefolia]|uniref:RNA-directed DNA polymerase n=1 Tax=Phytophthora fragariaefolia TaxID=1490495 RepID=A0A9W7D1B8_9STRA|nr:unnamed protein product [Phytophthora fragariaefolia]